MLTAVGEVRMLRGMVEVAAARIAEKGIGKAVGTHKKRGETETGKVGGYVVPSRKVGKEETAAGKVDGRGDLVPSRKVGKEGAAADKVEGRGDVVPRRKVGKEVAAAAKAERRVGETAGQTGKEEEEAGKRERQTGKEETQAGKKERQTGKEETGAARKKGKEVGVGEKDRKGEGEGEEAEDVASSSCQEKGKGETDEKDRFGALGRKLGQMFIKNEEMQKRYIELERDNKRLRVETLTADMAAIRLDTYVGFICGLLAQRGK